MIVADHQTLDRICTTAGSDLYRARRVSDSMPVLLKLVRPEHASASLSACFKREYLLLQSLHAAGIARPLALIEERGCLALALEDFAADSLEAVLARDLRMDLPVCLGIARDLAGALEGIHAARVIHRDIRPANILVAPQTGRALLVDLSVATAEESIVPAGDWAYVSPEQTGRMNRPLDYRTDFYSLGVLLYRLLTGRLPFQANDPLEWTHCHIARSPPPPHEIAPEVPQAVSDIVMKLSAKLPENRYQSGHGLQADLDRCLAQWRASGRIDSFPLGTEDVSDRFHIPHKLYGRDPEAGMLLAAFERMAATGQPALASVSGYSGIGKSSLVHELQRPIARERGYFIFGKFDQYQRDIPYATITQAFRELVQQLLSESEARIAGWRRQILAAVGANGQLIIDVLPQVELIIGEQPPVPALAPTDAQNRFRMVFRQFIAVFTSPEHPLVLFLDDLQWIDAASLTLIEHLLTHPDTRYLLLICAYRDNEVSAAHPLRAGLDTIRSGGVIVTDIQLAPLSIAHLNQLTADTLHAPPACCEPLTRMICERTEGNPFFFTQFLDALHKEGLLQQDAQHRVWQWDIDQIKAKDFADNVVDLMVGKLRQLPLPAQEALQLAACLGNRFDLGHLALVGGNGEGGKQELEQQLAPALQENLIVRTSSVTEAGRGKFLHDRIQQAAYSLIPEEQRAQVHLRIGRVLLASMTADELAENLFDVANQLNRGAAQIADRDEKTQVAAIALRAGRKAKASAAYGSARVYLAAGMALLDQTYWASQYELMFSLRLECAECEYLSGNFDQAEALIAELLARGASKIDKAAAYRLKIDLHVLKSENPKAIDSALECLRLFGIEMPAHPTREQVDAEYEKVWNTLGARPIESLIDLPLMTDPEMQAAMRVLSVLFAPACFTDVNLLRMHLCHMVNVSMKHGTTDASPQGYSWFGTTLGSIYRRYTDGYRFGKLACGLAEKHDFPACRAKTYFPMEMVILWTQPIEAALDCIRAAFRAGVEAGDLGIACYSCNHAITDLLLRGDLLDEVWRETERGLDFVRKARFRDVVDVIVTQQRFIENMRGRTAHFSTFSDAHFDEAAFEAQLTEDRMATMVCWYWILKLQARFISGDYEAAIAAAFKAKALLWSSDAHIQLLDYHYYGALAVAAAYEAAPLERQREWRGLLKAHQEQLHEWADSYPPTFADKHALVSAEIARLEGHDADAMRLYEEAIRSAREHGFVQNEAIAHELAAGFYLGRASMTAGHAHLAEARSCFARWGADGKVRQLDERMAPPREEPASPSAISLTNVAQLDLLSVAKASQAISGQIVLEDLVDTLMRIVLENAGAQTAHLLLLRKESLVLAAEAGVEQQTLHVRLHLNQAPHESALPASIVNYVRRSKERVLLADAAQSNPFSTDGYFARRQPKSVLCLPIMRQSALIGLLYLENNLATHAFTSERLAVLELLASQAAISLENALLYGDLRRSEAYLADSQRLSHTGSWAWSVGLREMIYRSAESFRIFGFDPAKDSSRIEAFRERVHPADRARHAEAFRNAIKTKTDFEVDFRVVLPSGSVNYAHAVGHPVFDAGGNVVELVGTTINVTEQHHARAALERALEDLRERETRIRRLVESNIIGVFFWDVAGAITDANDSFLQTVGYSREDLLSGNVSWSGMTPPEYRAADEKAIQDVMRSGSCQSYEKEFIRGDGKRVAVLIGGAIVEESRGQGVSFVLDLTERKHAEAERGARQAAEMANQAKSEFLARMSHELRTPLTGILGYAEILRGDRTLSERQVHGVSVIRQSGEHLLTLINDILDFARIEAGKLELNVTEIPMARFLRVIADIIGVRAEQKQLEFRCDIAADLPLGVLADERRLRQVLLNLLANAVKFTERGEVNLRVTFAPPSRLRFEVRDTGIGIGEDRREGIFQPFEQAGDMHHRFGGAGLGLAISRQLVRLMGGDIEVESRLGEGSAFWFELDLPVVQAYSAPASPETVITGYAGPRRNILVVDDVPANRMVLGDMLRPLGFEMAEAGSGREGLEKAQSLRPDLILMDSVMPETDGLEATRQLRQLRGVGEVAIIAISANASGSNEATAIAAGADAFLSKPIDRSALLAQIGELLQLQWACELRETGLVARDGAPGAVVVPPAHELALLHRLALLGNMRDIAREAAHLSELDGRYGAFADELKLLAKGYQSRAIVRLVERHINGASAP